MVLNVRENRCPQNHLCPAVRVCPFGALTQRGVGAPAVDLSKCTGCGKCVRVCPTGALLLTESERIFKKAV
jgi:ferredoxin